MEKVGQKFRSFAEAEQAEKQYYRSLSPNERMEVLLNLIKQGASDEAFQRLERVYQIVKLHGS